ATEQIWSWMNAPQGSVHRALWPTSAPYAQAAHGTDPNLLLWAGNALAELRGLKSQAKVSMKTPILHATLTATTDGVEALRQALDDIAEAGRVNGELGLAEAGAGAGAVGAGATGSAGAAVAGSTGSTSPANSTPGDTTGTTGTSSDTTTGAESAGEVPEFSVGIADDAELGEPPAKKPKHKG
ncbi:MAG: valine--tRNA ligase, partial [Bifidobacterium mongoliense]|nr:valine--tRNA ligase [Bifidobacterium mongoliense]